MVKLSEAMREMLRNVAKYHDPMRGIHGHDAKARADNTCRALERRGLIEFAPIGMRATAEGERIVREMEGEA